MELSQTLSDDYYCCGDCGALIPKENNDPNAWYAHINLHKDASRIPQNGKIITLCGSTRFYKTFDDANLQLTMKGYLVFSIGSHTMDDKQLVYNKYMNKKLLDFTHKQKIKLSDSILVLDVDGYIGESTKSEIEYAKKLKRRIYYLSKDGLEMLT